jgi:hypothetical protein
MNLSKSRRQSGRLASEPLRNAVPRITRLRGLDKTRLLPRRAISCSTRSSAAKHGTIGLIGGLSRQLPLQGHWSRLAGLMTLQQ